MNSFLRRLEKREQVKSRLRRLGERERRKKVKPKLVVDKVVGSVEISLPEKVKEIKPVLTREEVSYRANLEKIKRGKYYKEMVEAGFAPFTPEWRRESQRRSKFWKNLSPEQQRRHLEKAKERYHNNLEESRRKEREKKSERRIKDKEKTNAAQREYYQRNKVVHAQKQRLRRWRREPHRAIRANTDLYLQGLLDYEQYIKSVDEYIARAEQIERGVLREREELGEKKRTS